MKMTLPRSKKQAIVIAVGAVIASGAAVAEGVLEEVVVTAQKRAQSAQDIGIAVAAISGDAMREQGIVNGEDLAKAIPNFSVQNISGAGLPVVIVRGIGLQNFRINDSPTTSFYVDEVYQTSIASVEFSMFDMERVEVLKGPQGGLYGRNTIGGAVQVISAKPDIGEGFSGYVTAGYGKYARTQFEGGATIPLSDIAAARVSGRWEQSDDTDFESTTGDFEHGEQDRWAGRLQLHVTPSDTVDLNFKLHGGNDESESPLLRTVGLYQNVGNAGALGAEGVSLGLGLALNGLPGGGLCDAVATGNGADSRNCATLTGVTPADYGLGDSDDDRYDAAGDVNFQPGIENQWYGASLVATFELGDYSLTSVTGYDDIDYRRFNDADGTPVQFQDIDYGSTIEAWTQEFRLAYVGGDTVNWVVGINYAEDELAENTILFGAEGVLPLFFGGATFSPQDYVQETEAVAAYGHGEWRFADNWNLVGELRYTKEDKSFSGGQVFGFADGSTAPFLSTDDDTSFDAFSGKVGLDWTPADNVLVYGSVSQGFKTGGFFGGFVTSQAQFDPFDEETILAYELGIKSDWLDNRLRANGSIFFYDREDVQQSAADTSGTVDIARLSNVGDVEASGAELDLTWLATESLMLQLSLGYTDSETVESTFETSVLPLIADSSLEGTNTPNYSKFSANFIGRYEMPVTEYLLGSVQLEYSYRSDRDLSVLTNPALEKPLFREQGYGLVNLRVGIGAQDGQWKAAAFVDNLTDEVYRVEARADGLFGLRELYGPELTWGVNFTYNWE